jgi:hypothetical protein
MLADKNRVMPAKRRNNRELPATRAGLLSMTLKMIRGIEMHPELFPDHAERLAHLRQDFEAAKAAWDAITEDDLANAALKELKHEAILAGYYPFLQDSERSRESNSQYEQAMIRRFGFFDLGGRLRMFPPGAPTALEVLDVGDLGLDWILFAWEVPRTGGRVFGYKLQRRIAPNAVWQTVGLTDEGEILFLKVVRGIQHQYRLLAFNGAGETASPDILTYTLTPR